MILTKATVREYLRTSGQVGFSKLKHEFEVYDNDKNKERKLQDILDKLENARVIKTVQEISPATTLFGQTIVKTFNLPPTLPEYIYIGES